MTTPPPASNSVLIRYWAHDGRLEIRRIVPIGIRFDSSEWHPEPQWLLDAHDIGKQEVRSFAVKDIREWIAS